MTYTVSTKLNTKSEQATVAQALQAAKARFAERNVKSLGLHQEAAKSLPGGNTRSLLHTAPFPVFLKSGKGHQVTDEDGHTYTDLVGELTAGLYGHSQPLIQQVLIDTIKNVGLNLGGTTTLETRHAALICERFKLDRIRFTNSGTEANLHAIQGAKRFTGKKKVVVFTGGYHGGCYTFPGDRPAENCVDKDDWIIAEYNDIEDTKRKIEESEDVAAVLLEGMQGRGPCIVGKHDFLHQVQQSARKVGAVFILDEVQTSRLAPGGLQEHEGLQPDITTLGKFLGGGIAFGAFGGREDIMRVYDPRESNALGHSGTFNNNTLGMAAGYAGLSQVYTPAVCSEFSGIGDKLRQRLQDLTRDTKILVTGLGTIMGIHFLRDGKKELKSFRDRHEDAELRRLFWFEMMEDGFWITERGSVALIIGTPWAELERFVECVGEFLERHRSLVCL
ncbi:PLP-dependent transferase [Cucurbitaria berberidis CBS 394.84]|uniref:PLP-dependent transferase n=1 Tax=Cucurbitaria berberidis CBS 394.84 TaxID=1168544 RepID=A0A9P4GAG6_9PLEO|nr:PLP-dependent transferase [Cucurbitaria berberidis CBS 394.84]KAF1841674.1 PLP-dependent transferase [Cucurbitaria berberidis CBS 394.84]